MKATRAALRLPLLRPLLGSHAPWLALALLGTAVYSVRSWRRRALVPELALFALPLAYFLSYLPVWTSGDYRYMYPATLVCQGVAVSALVGWLLALRAAPEAAATNSGQGTSLGSSGPTADAIASSSSRSKP